MQVQWDEFGIETLFIELLHSLRDCKEFSDFQDFQDVLLEETVRAQLTIMDVNESLGRIKALRNDLLGLMKQANADAGAVRLLKIYQAYQDDIQDLKQAYQSLLTLLQLLGDAVAWQFFPRHIIRSMYQTSSPGIMLGKAGTVLELEIVERLRQEGFILMHDLTRVVRVGDLSVHSMTELNGLVIEAKKSQRYSKSPRELRQEERGKRLENYVKTGTRELEDGTPVVGIPSPDIELKYEWDMINRCLERAEKGRGRFLGRNKVEGLALAVSADGLALYMGLTPSALEEVTEQPAKLGKALDRIGWITRELLGPYNIMRGQITPPPFMPLMLTTISPVLVSDLLFGRLSLWTFVDFNGMNDVLRKHHLKIVQEDAGEIQFFLEGANGPRIGIGGGQLGQVFYEGLSVTSFIEMCRDVGPKARAVENRLNSIG